MLWADPTNPDPLGLAVKGRSKQHYDDYANELRQGSGGVVDQNQLTRNLIDNSQNSQALFSPWFQALQEASGSQPIKLAQDAARPHGLADDPSFGSQSGPFGRFGAGTGGNIPNAGAGDHPMPGAGFETSTSIGSPGSYRPRRTSLDVLQGNR